MSGHKACKQKINDNNKRRIMEIKNSLHLTRKSMLVIGQFTFNEPICDMKIFCLVVDFIFSTDKTIQFHEH